MTTTIKIELGDRSYPIHLGNGLLDQSHHLLPHVRDRRVLIVSNETVAPLYLAQCLRLLEGQSVHTLVLPDGESFKNLDLVSQIFDKLVAIKATRDSVLIALGGGVIGDITGFAAASYMRGVRFVQIPTTLLAQVDASVGGKTGVNHPGGKNLIGAFHQPECVLIDIGTLSSLNQREYIAGIAEVVKYGILGDRKFFDWISQHVDELLGRDAETLSYAIEQSCRNKALIVSKDEREAGARALLNLGHSFGHALETATSYERFLHGEAVSIGMVIAARLSENLGFAPQGTAKLCQQLLERLGLPVLVPRDQAPEKLATLMQLDKKNLLNSPRLILLRDIGEAFIFADCQPEKILSAIGLCTEGMA